MKIFQVKVQRERTDTAPWPFRGKGESDMDFLVQQRGNERDCCVKGLMSPLNGCLETNNTEATVQTESLILFLYFVET